MSLEDFRAYWLKDHARLVLEVPELCKYVQSHTLDSGYRKHEPIYDGIAELWYENIDAMRRIANLPASKAASDDDANFIDMSKFGFILTRERAIKENPVEQGAPKYIAFITRKQSLTHDQFTAHWRGNHAALGAAVPGVRRYVQSHVLPSAYKPGRSPMFDGVAESWFENDEAIHSAANTPEYKAVRGDEPNFLAADPPFIVAKEYVIL
jgi:uncharacterized protein (TIGR02118 family)